MMQVHSQAHSHSARSRAFLGARRHRVGALAAAGASSPMKGAYMTTDAAGLKAATAQLLKSPGPHFVIFSADRDPSTKQPWCPDCQRSLPAVIRAMAERGASLLEVTVGPRPVWKNPAHPFRTDPALKVTGIPTLMQWTAAGPGKRAGPELEMAPTPEAAAQVVAKFLKDAQ